jgi:hypothetical protein
MNWVDDKYGQCTRCGTPVYQRTLYRLSKPAPINVVWGELDHAVVDVSFERIIYYEYRAEDDISKGGGWPGGSPLKYCPGCGGTFRDTHPDL